MKIYSIYESPIAKTKVVKVGWSWPAFIFLFPWLILKGFWFDFILLMVLSISVGKLIGLSPHLSYTLTDDEIYLFFSFVFLISLLINITAGAYGNRMISKKLLKRGYIRTGTYTAPSSEAALAKHRRASLSADKSSKETTSIGGVAHNKLDQSTHLNPITVTPKSDSSFIYIIFIALLSIPFLLYRDYTNAEKSLISHQSINPPRAQHSTTPKKLDPPKNKNSITPKTSDHLKEETSIIPNNNDTSHFEATQSSGDWEVDSKLLIAKINNGDIKPRKASSSIALSQYFSPIHQNQNMKVLDKKTTNLIERSNIWWILPPKQDNPLKKRTSKFFIRLYNPSTSNLQSIIIAYTNTSCESTDNQEKTFILLDISTYPLRPNEYAVYYAPLPFIYPNQNHNLPNSSQLQCSTVTSALTEN